MNVSVLHKAEKLSVHHVCITGQSQRFLRGHIWLKETIGLATVGDRRRAVGDFR